ncbi:hypothetical protein AB0M02_09780 [Actinoplanes sp. NPDC051861]|uniref:hypothetical protein n=1 Tax=Actinoplanes sp. NPDC051861 TaxID=3155170 RepID=UPI00343E874C
MPRIKPDTPRLSKPEPPDQRSKGDQASVARAVLKTGGTFAAVNAGVLGTAGLWGLDLTVVLIGLGGVWIILALTFVLVYILMKR